MTVPKRWLGTDGVPIKIFGARFVYGKRVRFRPPLPNRGWRYDWVMERYWYPRLGWVSVETIAQQHRGGRTRAKR